jgi:hypothetical protein
MKLTITLEQNQWNVVLKYLGQGAYVEVAPIVESIAKQAAEQLNPKPDLQVVKSD